jgi:hypothetical protein
MNTRKTIKIMTVMLLTAPCLVRAENQVTLGSQSQKKVAISAFKGSVGAMATFAFLHWLVNDFKLPGIKEYALPYTVAASTGGILMALWGYSNTPESQFVYAQKGFNQFAQQPLLEIIANSDEKTLVDNLKEAYFRERFPLYSAFKSLDDMFMVLESYRASLDEVVASYRTDLYEQSYEILVLIDVYEAMIKDVMKVIKLDPNFIAECNAQTMVEIQYSQMVAAQAAQSSATAAWVQVFDPTQLRITCR